MNTKLQRQQKRAKRTRARMQGTKDRPRLSVYRSNAWTAVQFIDDTIGKTLLGLSEKQALKDAKKATKIERAKAFGILIAKKAAEKKIAKVIFDKGPYRYHGRVKALAEGAREGGLTF